MHLSLRGQILVAKETVSITINSMRWRGYNPLRPPPVFCVFSQVADFGVARRAEFLQRCTSDSIGTPGYSPPEV